MGLGKTVQLIAYLLDHTDGLERPALIVCPTSVLGNWQRELRRFAPDLLIVSAGFDAHVEDPLADMAITAAGFRELARRSAALAPRVAAVLEGGYNLRTLPGLVEATLEGFAAA